MAKTKEKDTKVSEAKPLVIKGIKKNQIVVILIIVIIVLLTYRFKSIFVAAVVNGQPVTRLQVVKQLEKEGGKTVLDNIVTNDLIMQEAAKEKVTVSQSEIDAQIAQITNNLKTQGEDLNTALAAQGMTQADLNDQIKLQVLVQKMATKNITVTDAEIADNFNQNKSTYPKGTKLDSVKDQIKSQLTQQKTSQAVTAWISALKSKAKINYFVSY